MFATVLDPLEAYIMDYIPLRLRPLALRQIVGKSEIAGFVLPCCWFRAYAVTAHGMTLL